MISYPRPHMSAQNVAMAASAATCVYIASGIRGRTTQDAGTVRPGAMRFTARAGTGAANSNDFIIVTNRLAQGRKAEVSTSLPAKRSTRPGAHDCGHMTTIGQSWEPGAQRAHSARSGPVMGRLTD